MRRVQRGAPVAMLYIRHRTQSGAVRYEVVEAYRDGDGRRQHRYVVSLGRCATVAAALTELEADDREDRSAYARQLALWPEPGTRPKHSTALLAAVERRRAVRRRRRELLEWLADRVRPVPAPAPRYGARRRVGDRGRAWIGGGDG